VAVALHRSGAHCGRSGFSSAEFKLEFVRMKLQRRRLRHDVPDIPATSVSRRGFGQLKVTTGLSSAFRFVIRRIVNRLQLAVAFNLFNLIGPMSVK
jgi:hypothetical protein